MFGSYAVIKPAEYVSFSNHPNQFVIETDEKASYVVTYHFFHCIPNVRSWCDDDEGLGHHTLYN